MRNLLLVALSTIAFITNAQTFTCVIYNATIVDVVNKTTIPKQTIICEDGIITEIRATSKKDKKTKHVTLIDGKGRYIMPSLCDMHVHLPKTTELRDASYKLFRAGVFKVRIMNSDTAQEAYTPLFTEMRQTNHTALMPQLYSSILVHRTDTLNQAAADSLISVAKSTNRFIKLFGLSNASTFKHLMKAANAQQVIVCGHYPRYSENGKGVDIPLQEVLQSGFRSIEHQGGYDRANDSMLNLAIAATKANKVFNCPTLDYDHTATYYYYPNKHLQRVTYSSADDDAKALWDSTLAADIASYGGKDSFELAISNFTYYVPMKKALLKKLYDNQCLLLVGSDPGGMYSSYGRSMVEEMMRWQEAGIDNWTIMQAATINPAMFFKEEAQWGSIAVGKEANLLIVDENPVVDVSTLLRISGFCFYDRDQKTKATSNIER
jgi:hypothetical protein